MRPTTATGAVAEADPGATPRIRLAHGGGGTLMQELIDAELRRLYADPDGVLHDAARLTLPHGRLAFTTDSYVVQPLEFEGGDIGSLAVTGTANDLAMAGARPLLLSLGLILEEGLELALLRRIIDSLAATARRCGMADRDRRHQGGGAGQGGRGLPQHQRHRPAGGGRADRSTGDRPG